MVIITIFNHKDIMINSVYNKANVMNQLKNMVHQHNISSRINQLINVYPGKWKEYGIKIEINE